MSKSTTPKYRIEYKVNDSAYYTPIAWNTRYGTPNAKNLSAWRDSMNQSLKYGGVNFDLSKSAGILLHVTECRLVEQKTGTIVAEVKMPMFEII
jgi:hypothetical protein